MGVTHDRTSADPMPGSCLLSLQDPGGLLSHPPLGLAGTREEGKNLLGLRVYEVRGLQVLGASVFLIALKGVLARC